MELSQVRYFILTAQLQNISKAARALNITQPTLSKSISNLEKELGTQLFDRSGRKIVLNERGKRFLDGAEISIQELDAAASAAQDQLFDSMLVLGLYHLSDRFMSCISEFSNKFPDTIFQIWQLESSSNSIDTNDFDMLLYPKSPLFRKYKGVSLYTEPYYLAVHKSCPLASRKTARLEDLTGQKLVFIKYDKKIYDIPYHVCVNYGIAKNRSFFTNSYEIQRRLISENCGTGFIPVGCSESYVHDGQIALLTIDEIDMSQEVMVGFKREKHLNMTGKKFSEFVLEYFGR